VSVVPLDWLDFNYYEYYFYSIPRRQKGMTIIKYQLYRFFVRYDYALRFLAVKDKKRNPRAETI